MDRKEWIKPYRDVVEQQFRLDDAARKDVDDFFARLEQMAAGQRDQAAFATAFMQSPLYQEYTGLFTKYQQMVVTQSGETVKEAAATMKKDSAKGLPGEYAKDMATREVKAAVSHMLPDEVNRLRWAGARALPVIGPIVQWIDNINWLRRLFGRGMILVVAVVLATSQMAAQTAREELKANRFLSAGNYLNYENQLTDKPLTPSPAGYEPFYMSHYGRHGSRWLTSSKSYTDVEEAMSKAQKEGKLTTTGKETLEKLMRFLPCTEKRAGDLTTVGERQHHGIARRMVQHFPEIFMKENVPIDARSTTVIRCILSMTAECEELAAANPSARFHNDASKALQFYLAPAAEGEVKKLDKTGNFYRKTAVGIAHPERLMNSLFNDAAWWKDSIDINGFINNLFDIASNMQSHDTDIEFYSLFTDDELYEQWRTRNIGWYMDYGPSPATKGVMPMRDKELLKNFIETADTVTQTQATLRFGHEVYLMPLACLLELDSCNIAVSDTAELDQHWRNYRIFPMASNIQLVFYRPTTGAQGDILVKALLNEKEVTLPVPTDQYPYYKWTELRKYYLEKIAKFEKSEQSEKSE